MAIDAPSWEAWQAGMTHTPSGSAPSSRSRRDYYDNFVNAINNAPNDNYAQRVIADHSLGDYPDDQIYSVNPPGWPTPTTSAILERPKTEAQIRAEQLKRAGIAQSGARDYGLNKLNEDFTYHGFNPEDYSTQIERYLTGIGETIDPYDENAKQYYTGDIFGELKGNIEAENVGRYQNELDQFLGSGWENSYVNPSLGESTINSILGQQYGDATGAIDRAYKRGTLTDTGQQYSLGQLGQQYEAGYSTMDNLRDGIVSGYRNDLVGQGNDAYNKLNTYSLGDTFDSSAVQSDIGKFYNTQKAGFGGNFRADFGNQQLFDWNSLIQKGGINQGVSNQAKTSPDVLAALGSRQVDEEANRGLGSQGVF